MKLLLLAALRNSRHLTLAILTLVSLLFLTVANQFEMFSVGLMANSGADFFTLFSPDGKKVKDKVKLEEVVRKKIIIFSSYLELIYLLKLKFIMEEELVKKITALEQKIDEMYKITMAAKKMFIWSLVLSLLFFVIPLIILMFILPSMLDTMTSNYSGLL